jgi:hypothetical protein
MRVKISLKFNEMVKNKEIGSSYCLVEIIMSSGTDSLIGRQQISSMEVMSWLK